MKWNQGHKEAVQDNDAVKNLELLVRITRNFSIESELWKIARKTQTMANWNWNKPENEEFVQDYDAIETKLGLLSEDYMTRDCRIWV